MDNYESPLSPTPDLPGALAAFDEARKEFADAKYAVDRAEAALERRREALEAASERFDEALAAVVKAREDARPGHSMSVDAFETLAKAGL